MTNEALRDEQLHEPSEALTSDRGSPYAGAAYRAAPASHGNIVSMSRKGDCWDNAVAASFVATLRAQLVEHERYSHHDAAAISIGDYIDNFERHSLLGYLVRRRHHLQLELHSGLAATASALVEPSSEQ
jgi:putative transposase